MQPPVQIGRSSETVSRVFWAPCLFLVAVCQIVGDSFGLAYAEEETIEEQQYVRLVPPSTTDLNLDPKLAKKLGEVVVIDGIDRSLTPEEAEMVQALLSQYYNRYNGKHVYVEGTYESMFEHSAIAGLWVDFTSGVSSEFFKSEAYKQAEARAYANKTWITLPVTFWGVIDTGPRGHGHAGQYPATLTVERVVVREATQRNEDLVRLRNGNTLEGNIVIENEREVVIEVPGTGNVTLTRSEITSIQKASGSPDQASTHTTP